MNTQNEAAPLDDPGSPPVGDAPPAQGAEPQRPQVKAGIGGCLLYPLLFLVAQPFLFINMLRTASRPSPMTTYRIYWPGMIYMIYDLLLLAAVVLLLVLFLRKRAVLPALFVFFLVSFSILSTLLVWSVWRLPEAHVVGRDPMGSQLVLLFHCLLLMPYFVLDGRVKNTFVQPLDDFDPLDALAKPIAAPAQRLYGWLVRRGKKVFVCTFAFVIGVFLLGWGVDSIVLYCLL